jgi:hypothetical protein
MTENKDLGELLAVDMPNGYTYIGKSTSVGDRPLMLKEAFTVKTDSLSEYGCYINGVTTKYDAEKYKTNSDRLEKEIRIDNPGTIHFLKQ